MYHATLLDFGKSARRKLMLRKIAVLAALSFALAGWAAGAHRDGNVSVKIMTQNMDDGTDLTYVIAALTGQMLLPDAVDLTFAELQASNFGERDSLLAAEIAERKPDIVALQEAVLWRFGPTPDTATDVLYDQLDLLLSALKKLKVPYDVVAVNRLSDLALPGGQIGGALRFTDRNAVLVRSTYEENIPTFESLIANVDVRWKVCSSNMPKMNWPIRIGKCGSHKNTLAV
jgi:hypothetical protein